MMTWKEYLKRRSVIRAEIESWPVKEQEFAIFTYGLIKNIEAIDFTPFIMGMIPLALIYRGIGNGFIPSFLAPAGNYNGPMSIGAAFLIYAVTAAAMSKFVVKKLQMKWISELYQKMSADKEIAAAYEKLEHLDPYIGWRIRNTFSRLNKLF